MRVATERGFREDLVATVRELMARGVTVRSIRRTVTDAVAQGPWSDDEAEDDE
jgi:hypothetical protein